MSNSKFDEWAFDQTVKKGGTIFGCKDKDGVNVGFVNTGTGEYFSLIDEWISVTDELPNVRCIAYMPNPDKSLEYRFIPEGLFKQVATEATHWQPLPPPPQQPTGKG